MQQAQQENKMGVMPVNRLIITMSLPMIVSMLVTALYNVVDSIFVARIGEKALTAPVFIQTERRGKDRPDKPEYKVKINAALCFSNTKTKVISLMLFH